MRQPELYLQKACVTWFRLQYPRLSRNLFSIPNSNDLSAVNRRGAITVMAKLKQSGLVVGACDLMLSVPCKGHNGLFIEMKIKPNKPSPEQLLFMDAQMTQGYYCEVVYSFDRFREIVEGWISGEFTA